MPHITPTTEPTELRAGLNWTWSKAIAHYPADVWQLRYWYKNASAHFEITAAASGVDHLVSHTASQTAGIIAGMYDWVATVEDLATHLEKWEVATGRLEVLPVATTMDAGDLRTTARRILEQLEASYADYMTNGQGMVQSYQIGDRQMEFKSSSEFIQAIEYWRGQVAVEDAAEAIASGMGNPRHVYVRWGAS